MLAPTTSPAHGEEEKEDSTVFFIALAAVAALVVISVSSFIVHRIGSRDSVTVPVVAAQVVGCDGVDGPPLVTAHVVKSADEMNPTNEFSNNPK
jgi:hypothetical protein